MSVGGGQMAGRECWLLLLLLLLVVLHSGQARLDGERQ